ncbi:MAG: helix-turn-helix transcriptional regulator [Candidatus Binataceae bacterium]
MAKNKGRDFGQVIRERRRQLDLTQEQVARRIGTSIPYVGHLESGKRHPSDKVVMRLADVLGVDRRWLFFLANPHLPPDVTAPPKQDGVKSAWEEFCEDTVRRIHKLSKREIETLRGVELMGAADFPYILYTIRQVSGYPALAKPARAARLKTGP